MNEEKSTVTLTSGGKSTTTTPERLLEVAQELSLTPDSGVVKGLAQEALAKAVKALENEGKKLEKDAALIFMVPHREQLNILARANYAAALMLSDLGEEL